MHEIAQFLTNPYVMGVILAIGMIGIAVELMSPGFGAPGVTGLVCFFLYFWAHFTMGTIGWGAPAMFVLGAVLLALELMLPTLGILGVIGFVMILASLVMAAANLWAGVTALVIGLALAGIILWMLIRFIGLKASWNRIVLKAEQSNEKGYVSAKNRQDLLGKEGVAVTPLRPSGFARFGDRKEDVVSEGEIIPQGAKVKVIAVEGARVVVRKTEE
ncbi:MAG: NfeD family protein [Thermoactinomyces sp.]|jgi:membrane-bound serine protease (ClpP class)